MKGDWISMMKKAFYLGLGVMSMTRDRAERFYNEMIEKGQVSKEEARQFVDEAIKKGEEEKKEVRQFIREEMDDLKKEIPVVTRAELEALEARIKELEQKIQQ
jgi:polyhydroxyalkanoate synthesis regulator phasin